MARKLSCREGGHDCAFEIESENENELIDFVQIHARSPDEQLPESDVRVLIQSS